MLKILMNDYLRVIGAKEVSWTPGNEFVSFIISIRDAEDAFETNFFNFRHIVSGRMLTRAASKIRIPVEVSRHIDVTTGLQDFFGK